ncbi:hypothetical protein [Streptomyces sp. NPDC047928]|uniref:hypothetical protein n=1 Tax=unclassified Streptomyces TaxID=2593676 RepID=UPI003713FF7D
MPVTFNHTIIPARNRDESARFFRELFELSEAPSWGPFTNIQLGQGVLLQFAELPGVDQIQMHHYAFLVDDDLFDRAYARLQAGGTKHWADPQMTLTVPATPPPTQVAPTHEARRRSLRHRRERSRDSRRLRVQRHGRGPSR